MKIGVIDSGKGGEYVASVIAERFNVETYIAPKIFYKSYSNMSMNELKRECNFQIEVLKNLEVNIIVVGCMTLSTNLLDYIKDISNVPVYDLYTNLEKFDEFTLLIGTFNTVNSGKFSEYHTIACPDIAPAIEDGYLALVQGLLRGYEYRERKVFPFNKVILGCSHYSTCKNIFKDYYKNITIIDPVDYLLERLNEKIHDNVGVFSCSNY